MEICIRQVLLDCRNLFFSRKERTQPTKNHVITLDNSNIQIKITFGKTRFKEKLGVDLGAHLERDYGPGLYAHYFTVEWVINTKRLRRWSTRTKEQIGWAKEVGESYQTAFSFSLLEQALNKRYLS